MELFEADGKKKSHYDRRQEAAAGRYDVVNGAMAVNHVNGYTYKDLYRYSFLQPYDVHGIRQSGGEYVEWRSDEIPDSDRDVVFAFEMAMGNGAAWPQPTGEFHLSLNGTYLLSFTVVKYDEQWQGNGAALQFHIKRRAIGNFGKGRTLDEWIRDDSVVVAGAGLLRVPRRLLTESVATFRVHGFNREPSRNWFRLGITPMNVPDLRQAFGQLERGRHREIDGVNVYFGDLHTHSNESMYLDNWGCGTGSWDENFRYARDISCLDFFCMSDHDFQLDQADWAALLRKNDEYNEPGRFVTIKGYEWTCMEHGHRNVYFRDTQCKEVLDAAREKAPVRYGNHRSGDHSPEELWAWLDELGDDAITVPHHPNCAQFILSMDQHYSEEYDRLIEIYSNWGSSDARDLDVTCNNDRVPELEVTQFLNRYKVGLIASSDGHDGNPGNGNICRKRIQLGHYLGSGKVAVLADELTRDSVFDALRDRRCYAVTGAPILLRFSVNDIGMGSELAVEPGQDLSIKVHAIGTDTLREVRLMRGNEDIDRVYPETAEATVEFTAHGGGAYFVKIIQDDDEMAWSSPVWVAESTVN